MTDRSIDLSVEVPGTPEEVWEAIATGPGISSWFVPCEVEEREGGLATTDFGDFGKATATVTAWEPPTRVVFGEVGGAGLAYEWLVEARDGGTCVVRLVNSGFTDEGGGDLEGMTGGWRIFLNSLRLHLTHFRGRHAVTSVPVAMVPGPNADAWKSLCAALGVAPSLGAGERLSATAEGAPPLEGVVDHVTRTDAVSEYTLLLERPEGSGFVACEGNGDQVAISLYLYLYGDDAAADGERWRDWWAQRFPKPEAAAPSG